MKGNKIMLVCAIIIMSWFILISLVQLMIEFQKFEPKGLNVLHCIVIITMSIFGIIGVANVG
jgi:hypothetical protein